MKGYRNNEQKLVNHKGETKQIRIIQVDGDGDCGYSAYGTTREEAARILTSSIDSNRDDVIEVLQLAIKEEIVFDNGFLNHLTRLKLVTDERVIYMNAVQVAGGELIWEAFKQEYNNNSNRKKEIALAYINYSIISQKKWAHTADLQALATAEGLNLTIYDGNILISRNYLIEMGYNPAYQHIQHPLLESINIIYSGSNHFDKLQMFPSNEPIPNLYHASRIAENEQNKDFAIQRRIVENLTSNSRTAAEAQALTSSRSFQDLFAILRASMDKQNNKLKEHAVIIKRAIKALSPNTTPCTINKLQELVPQDKEVQKIIRELKSSQIPPKQKQEMADAILAAYLQEFEFKKFEETLRSVKPFNAPRPY